MDWHRDGGDRLGGHFIVCQAVSLFDSTVLTIAKTISADNTGPNSETVWRTTETQNGLAGLAPAVAAMVLLIVFGWLLISVGVGLAVAEATKPAEQLPTEQVTTTREDGTTLSILPIPDIGGLAKALAEALKDLRSSTASMVLGTVLLVGGLAIAWQTIPERVSTSTDTTSSPTTDTTEGD